MLLKGSRIFIVAYTIRYLNSYCCIILVFQHCLAIFLIYFYFCFICHKNTSMHLHIDAFFVKWSEELKNLKGLYVPIQIQMFYRHTTQMIAAAIK